MVGPFEDRGEVMKRPIITLATNNGDVGGGEVMLLNLAKTMNELGFQVRVVGPREPSDLVDRATLGGFETTILDAATRIEYMIALRQWDTAHRAGILWCNGLLPALATAGHSNRVVHLHQQPLGMQRPLSRLARLWSMATVVPSHNMADAIAGSTVLHNWVERVPSARVTGRPGPLSPTRVGFLGRPSIDKGIDVLADALRSLDMSSRGAFRLVLAGEPRFVNRQSQIEVAEALKPIQHLVESTGWIPPEAFFAQVDLLVCPSTWPEPFGLVIAEAMSARVPFIISDAGALPEVAGAGHPWVFSAGDSSDLAQVMKRAATSNNQLHIENAYMRWKDQFSPEAGKQRLQDLLAALPPAHSTRSETH